MRISAKTLAAAVAVSSLTAPAAFANDTRYELRINCSACPGGYSSGGVYSSYKKCYEALKSRRENGDNRDMGCMQYYG